MATLLFPLERFTMAAAKKAVPAVNKGESSSRSLDDLLNGEKENQPDTTAEETLTGEDAATVVVENPAPPVDNQVDQPHVNDDDEFGNVDGVTNSGNENVINKTPADLAAETPEQSARRYGIGSEVPEDVIKNPNVQQFGDANFQIPSGTHLHPDVARDNYNRSLQGGTESGATTRVITSNVYAAEAEVDDKGIKGTRPEPEVEVFEGGTESEYAPVSDNDDKGLKFKSDTVAHYENGERVS